MGVMRCNRNCHVDKLEFSERDVDSASKKNIEALEKL